MWNTFLCREKKVTCVSVRKRFSWELEAQIHSTVHVFGISSTVVGRLLLCCNEPLGHKTTWEEKVYLASRLQFIIKELKADLEAETEAMEERYSLISLACSVTSYTGQALLHELVFNKMSHIHVYRPTW